VTDSAKPVQQSVQADRLSVLPKPTTPTEVRSRLIDMLRRDLVGPHPDIDPDLAGEVLSGTSPSNWYLTGFLASRSSGVAARRTAADPKGVFNGARHFCPSEEGGQSWKLI
jgi:hypothetical protein